MRQSVMPVLTVLAALGLVLLARGITGMAVSQTCCSGVSCASDSVCDEYQVPAAASGHDWYVAGILLLFVCTVVFVAVEINHPVRQ